jgi:hypothetical protein
MLLLIWLLEIFLYQSSVLKKSGIPYTHFTFFLYKLERKKEEATDLNAQDVI